MSYCLYESKSYKVFKVFNVLFLTIASLLCVLPLVHILAVSLSSSRTAAANMVSLWPCEFTFSSYQLVLHRADFWQAFLISLERTLIGTVLNMVLTILLAYPLSKKTSDFKVRNILMWMLIFVMLFNGGLVPTYMLVYKLGLIDTIWSLILPGAVPIFNVVLMMNFIRQLPKAVEEAAFIDGASYFSTLYKIIIPLSKPVIATLVLFCAVGHWNEYFSGLIYMNHPSGYPLQTFLHTIVVGRDITSMEQAKMFNQVSDRTLKSAQLFIAMVPVLAIYPFLQKYFISGIVIGSVKG